MPSLTVLLTLTVVVGPGLPSSSPTIFGRTQKSSHRYRSASEAHSNIVDARPAPSVRRGRQARCPRERLRARSVTPGITSRSGPRF